VRPPSVPCDTEAKTNAAPRPKIEVASAAPQPEIEVEVAYAAPQRSVLKSYRLTVPAAVAEVLTLAAADEAFAGIDLEHCAVGVFGQLAARGQWLNHGDRVEIYRPLAADPKTARRARAREARRNPGR
jgi:putative ubiquitin-RnfH superfamily antitoxin RatB of RatAB toxin-antitoxin module